MSIFIRDTPDVPLLIMYNIYTDELGISSEGWNLVAITNLIPFVRYIATDDYEEYEGGHSGLLGLDTGTARRIGYVEREGVVEKNSDWHVIGEF
jgi:hypothetical protein